jgi:hypothetical protein
LCVADNTEGRQNAILSCIDIVSRCKMANGCNKSSTALTEAADENK